MTVETTPTLQPDSGPLQHAELSELRHNLRTPINHVLGYTEMLMEDATDNSLGVLEELRAIHVSARAALQDVNEALGNRESVERAELGALCEGLRPRVDAIDTAMGAVRDRPPADVPAEWAADLQRIQEAAHAILAVLSGGTVPDAPPEGPAAHTATPQTTAARILVVDDNATNRNMLVRRLQRQGYRVEEAANGGEALDRIATESFDLVLLDIMMPVMDGFEVLARMKADRRMRAVPVVVISALNEMDSAVRAIQMGAEDYLFKPFDPVLLRARIGALVEKRRLLEELTVQQKLASLGALTAGIAHEIKNPLNFVINFAQLSADLVKEGRQKVEELAPVAAGGEKAIADLREICADLEENVAKIREHGARADGIIGSMLAHSRGQRGERRPIDLNGLVHEYVNLSFHGMRAQDHTFQATIEEKYDPAVGIVDVIPQDLSRVILNVASNAFYAVRKKARESGRGYEPLLRVSTAITGDCVEIRFHDNGTGIHKDVLDRIFDPFFTTKAAGEGTGLGLSISYEIVVGEHGGEMRANSVEGEFTDFTITLPRTSAGGA